MRTIDIFTQKEFEAALPAGYWEYTGFVEGEHTYGIKVAEGICITIRSSVGRDGMSADTGEDSIRAWLIRCDGSPLGSKVSKYTTRLPGWEKRLLEVLRALWGMAQKAGYCDKCHQPRGVFKVKKAGPTKGKLFAKCANCNTFEWLEEG